MGEKHKIFARNEDELRKSPHPVQPKLTSEQFVPIRSFIEMVLGWNGCGCHWGNRVRLVAPAYSRNEWTRGDMARNPRAHFWRLGARNDYISAEADLWTFPLKCAIIRG